MANFSNINNKFIVTDGGNILIGQTANDASSPKLQVAGSIMSSSSSLLAAPTTASIVIDYHSSSNAGRIMTGSGAAWNKNLALVPYGGNVGIGTVSPVGKLQVSLPTYTNEDTNSQQAIFGVDSGYGVRIGYNETDNKGYINVLKPGVAWGSLILQEDIGKVGIGTDSPQRPLHVNGTEGVARFTSTASGNNGFEVGIGVSSQAFLWLAENSHMEFATNNIERMRIDNSGYISTPADKRISVGAWDNSGLTSGAAFGFSVQSTSPGLFLKETDQTNRKGFLAMLGGGMYIGGSVDFFAIDVANGNRALTINDSLNVGIGTTSPLKLLTVKKATSTTTIATSEVIRLAGTAQAVGNKNELGFANYDNNYNASVVIGAEIMSTAGYLKQDLYFATRDSTSDISPTERMRITSTGAISVGSSGTAYGAAGEVLTSNGNASPSWQAAGGGGSAWPQEKFAVYTINSTTSNILIATMNSTTWHGDYQGGCLKFTINDTNYIQVSYVTVYTYLSGTNKWFFKGNTEMTEHNLGTNPFRYVFAFTGAYGAFGPTTTLKINRVSNGGLGPVNVLVQAISSPDMFILN